jgi:hypothetical protein
LAGAATGREQWWTLRVVLNPSDINAAGQAAEAS